MPVLDTLIDNTEVKRRITYGLIPITAKFKKMGRNEFGLTKWTK
ncbi:hypothetical protein [Clostridium cochlearium]|nr:hypothetical protein [Clostridium cochlearium]